MHDDIEAIRQLKARYFRTLDTKDWAALRRCFTDDVHVDTSASGGGVVDGADAFIAFLQGIWALHDIVIWPTGMRLDGYGHYHETYAKVGDEWRIASSTLTRLHTDLTT